MIYIYAKRFYQNAYDLYKSLCLETLDVEFQVSGTPDFASQYSFSYAIDDDDLYPERFTVLSPDFTVQDFLPHKQEIYDYYGIENVQYLKVFNRENELAKLKDYSIDKLKINYKTEFLDGTLCIVQYKGSTQLQRENLLAIICRLFDKDLYAFERISLQQVLVNMLTLKEKKMATAESITGGMIASTIVDISGASNVLHEGCVTYSPQSKQNRLSVLSDTLTKYTAVSSQVCTQMVKGALFTSKANYAVATTGYAESQNSVDFSNGLCYIGVGDAETTFVEEYHFTGDRNTVRKCATNTAIFNLIKLCKKY